MILDRNFSAHRLDLLAAKPSSSAASTATRQQQQQQQQRQRQRHRQENDDGVDEESGDTSGAAIRQQVVSSLLSSSMSTDNNNMTGGRQNSASTGSTNTLSSSERSPLLFKPSHPMPLNRSNSSSLSNSPRPSAAGLAIPSIFENTRDQCYSQRGQRQQIRFQVVVRHAYHICLFLAFIYVDWMRGVPAVIAGAFVSLRATSSEALY